MEGFHLDTSGMVYPMEPRVAVPGGLANAVKWIDLSPFEQGYVKALFAANAGALEQAYVDIGQSEPVGHPDQAALAFSDLAPETLATILKDCERLAELIVGCVTGGDVGRGRVAWTWRQQERAEPNSPAGALHRDFPPLTVYLGDDDKVRTRPATPNAPTASPSVAARGTQDAPILPDPEAGQQSGDL